MNSNQRSAQRSAPFKQLYQCYSQIIHGDRIIVSIRVDRILRRINLVNLMVRARSYQRKLHQVVLMFVLFDLNLVIDFLEFSTHYKQDVMTYCRCYLHNSSAFCLLVKSMYCAIGPRCN